VPARTARWQPTQSCERSGEATPSIVWQRALEAGDERAALGDERGRRPLDDGRRR